MRLFISLLTAAAVAGCTPPSSSSPPPAPVVAPAGAPTASAIVLSRGLVHAVTREHNAITIEHEAIPEYGMGAMMMEFTVANPAQLESIEAGDRVTFELSGPIDIATISKVD